MWANNIKAIGVDVVIVQLFFKTGIMIVLLTPTTVGVLMF